MESLATGCCGCGHWNFTPFSKDIMTNEWKKKKKKKTKNKKLSRRVGLHQKVPKVQIVGGWLKLRRHDAVCLTLNYAVGCVCAISHHWRQDAGLHETPWSDTAQLFLPCAHALFAGWVQKGIADSQPEGTPKPWNRLRPMSGFA